MALNRLDLRASAKLLIGLWRVTLAYTAEPTSAHWRPGWTLPRARFRPLRQAVGRGDPEGSVSLLDRKIAASPAHRCRPCVPGERFIEMDFPGVNIVVTDLDPDRLEQAKAALGEDNRACQLRSLGKSSRIWPAATFDLAAAIDAPSEVARDRVKDPNPLQRLLRPNAPLVAGEPAPSLFWDIVRGSPTPHGGPVRLVPIFQSEPCSPSANGLMSWPWPALSSVSGGPVLDEESIGVIVRGLAGNALAPSDFFHPGARQFPLGRR